MALRVGLHGNVNGVLYKDTYWIASEDACSPNMDMNSQGIKTLRGRKLDYFVHMAL